MRKDDGAKARFLIDEARSGGAVLIGVDEVGRGAWCGPVVAGAAAFLPGDPEGIRLAGLVRDSKALSKKAREDLSAALRPASVWALGAVSAPGVDALGIRPATLKAMSHAVLGCVHRLRLRLRLRLRPLQLRSGGLGPDVPDDFPSVAVIVDGQDEIPGLEAAFASDFEGAGLRFLGQAALVKGDALVPEASAASILAKVARDKSLSALAKRLPGGGWGEGAGYGTAAHAAFLRAHGPTPHHRRSFRMPGKDV